MEDVWINEVKPDFEVIKISFYKIFLRLMIAKLHYSK